MDDMRGRVAIVTGGGTGIGAAVVRKLAARGAHCVINYASSRDEAETLAAEVGNGAIAVRADVAEDADCRALAPTIRVNAVAPGYVGTGWFEKRLGAEGFAKLNDMIAGKTPMAMAAGPDDIAGPVVMLLDPGSRAITGETILIDAGAHLDVGLTRRPEREI